MAVRLAAAGWTILARQLRVGRSEVDLLAIDPGPPAWLVVVEVRARRNADHGWPEETVDGRKRLHLHAAGFALLELGALPDGTAIPRLPLRFDLVAIEGSVQGSRVVVRHHRAAF